MACHRETIWLATHQLSGIPPVLLAGFPIPNLSRSTFSHIMHIGASCGEHGRTRLYQHVLPHSVDTRWRRASAPSPNCSVPLPYIQLARFASRYETTNATMLRIPPNDPPFPPSSVTKPLAGWQRTSSSLGKAVRSWRTAFHRWRAMQSIQRQGA